MQPKTIYKFIDLGTVLRYLLDTEEGTPFKGTDYIEDNIERFFQFLREFNFIITLQASEGLLHFSNELKTMGKRHKLSTREASRLRNIIAGIHLTLLAEATVRQAFVVTDKRIRG